MTEIANHSKKGAIVFLDFLGWKGIWLGDYKKSALGGTSPKFDYHSLDELNTLLQEIEKRFSEKSANWDKSKPLDTKFISISDTIAMFTSCDDDSKWNELLELQSTICGDILDMAAGSRFALRGAITVGEYATLNNIMVGPGVDECASWYEQANWLGVIFAPSAQFVIDQAKEAKEQDNTNMPKEHQGNDSIAKYDNIPLKGGFKGLKYCVQWGQKEDVLNKLLKNTLSLPIDVAQKYINTQAYLYWLRKGTPSTGLHNDDK